MAADSVRLARLLAFVLAACAFLLPLSAISGVLAWLVLGTVALAAIAPALATAMTVVALPLSASLAATLPGGPARPELVDAMVLALAAGVALHALRVRGTTPSALAAPAAILAAAIVTSAIVELHALQVVAPRRPLLAELWTHVTTAFWSDPRAFPALHDALRWLTWLVIAVGIERVVATGRGILWPAWLAAGAVGALLTILRFVEVVVRHGGPVVDAVAELLRDLRVTVLQPDLNAAGSYFLLFLVPAIVVALRRRPDWMALATLPLTAFAFAMARSRAAIGAAVMMGAVAFIAWGLPAASPGRTVRRAALALGVVVLGVVVALAATTTTNADPGRALGIRVELAEVALTTAARYPVFGVGISDYIRSTRRFITDDQPLLQRFAPLGENAHNNFLQIAVELGIPAGLVFLWLVLPTALATFGRRGLRAPLWARGMGLGIAAFLVSALFGHPLLISQVGATFFVGLGMAAGGLGMADNREFPASPAAPAASLPLRTRIALAGVAFYVVSLAWRL